MTKTEIAYLAGFFDGEGYVGMNKRKKGKYTEYIVQVSIGQKDGEIMDYLKKSFGGTLHTVKRDGSYQWVATNRIAFNFLKTLYPYLKYKRPQVKLALSFYEGMVQGSFVSEVEKERRQGILEQLKEAKRIFSSSQL